MTKGAMGINGDVLIAFWITDFEYDLVMVKEVSGDTGDERF